VAGETARAGFSTFRMISHRSLGVNVIEHGSSMLNEGIHATTLIR